MSSSTSAETSSDEKKLKVAQDKLKKDQDKLKKDQAVLSKKITALENKINKTGATATYLANGAGYIRPIDQTPLFNPIPPPLTDYSYQDAWLPSASWTNH